VKYIILLSIITIISIYLGYICFKKNRSVSIIIGLLLIYYWTFNGAWLFVFDVLSGFRGKDIGFTYYIIGDKMFPLHLDSDYFMALVYYGIFHISMLITMVFGLPKKDNFQTNKVLPFSIRTGRLLIISFIAIVLSYLCVHHKFLEAYNTKIALYYVIRCTPNKYNTLHMLFNLISVFSAYFSLVTFFSSKNARYFYSRKNTFFIGITIFFNILLISIYFIIIGNKHDLMFAGLFGFLFYFSNNIKIEVKKIILIVFIVVFPLTITDFVRGLPLLNYTNIPDQDIKVYTTKKVPSYMNVLFNNEMFYAHFSMYGALSQRVELTYGKSIINLAESFIPRIIREDRDEDVYTHYTNSIRAKKGQGYTIHHATGWYINFGVWGIFIGGIMLGLIWSFFYRMNCRLYRYRNNLLIIIFSVAPSLFISFIPNLIRNGFEAYKPLIFEAILIPSIIIYLSHFDISLYFKTKIIKE
jgi:hypothetical protein